VNVVPTIRWPTRIALMAALTGLALTAAVTVWQAQRNDRATQAELDALAQRAARQIGERMKTYEYGLRGMVLALGDGTPTRGQFEAYMRSRDMDREFPGARGIGWIARVPAEAAQHFEAERLQQDGRPFAIHQLTPHAGERWVIVHVGPYERNREAAGLDIASEPHRRATADAAMRSGRATLTAPITIMQAARAGSRSFLLLLPVYRGGTAPADEAGRVRATLGWTYAPLVIDEVLAGLDLRDGEFTISLRDAAAADEPFHASARQGADRPTRWRSRVPVEVHGRQWQAELQATPRLQRRLEQTSPALAALVGTALSMLLGLVASLQARGSLRARQVQSERARRAAIVAASNDAIVGVGMDCSITDWNAAAERLFGHSAQQAIGRPFRALLLPPERAAEDERVCSAVEQGQAVPAFDTQRLHRDGHLLEVTVAAAPILGADGRVAGLAMTLRDIGPAKRAEREIRELNAGLERLVQERTVALERARHDLQNTLDAVPALVSYWDRSLCNRFANHAFREWFGRDCAAMAGTELREIVGEPLFEQVRPQVKAALLGVAQVFERTLPSRGGGERHTVIHHVPDIIDGKVAGFYAVVQDVTPQVQAQRRLAAALRDNETLLRTIRLHTVFSVADRAGRIVDVNDRFCQLSGYTREELLDQDHRMLGSGVHDADFWQSMWATVAAGEPWRGEVCNRAKDGSLYWVNTIIVPFTGEDGAIERYISIRTDVTPAKLAEQRLRASEAFLDRTGRVAGVGGWEYEMDSGRIIWSAQTYRIHEVEPGYTPNLEEAIRFYAPQAREAIRDAVRTCSETGQGWDLEVPFITAKGREIWVRAVGAAERESGRVVRLVGAFQDISMRKQIEAQLQAAHERFSIAAHAAGIGVWEWDVASNTLTWDEGMYRLYACPRSAAAEPYALWAQAVHPEDLLRCEAALQAALDGTRDYDPEFRVRLPEGTVRHVKAAARVLRDAAGRALRMTGVNIDITERKHAELALQEAKARAEQASLAKGRFLANMSHEIRTPLNAVLGLTHLLEQTRLDREQEGFVAKVRLAGAALLEVVNDVLDLSKIEAGELLIEHAPFRPARLLEELEDLMSVQAQAKGLRLAVEAVPALPEWVLGDAARLRQVLTNLLGNAIKFTERGSVRLRVLPAGGTRLRFEVHDTGIGIAPEAQARLFKPFAQADASTTRRFGGTGLGLSIVKRLGEMMGGAVGLDSTPGQGSLFWVELPLPPAETGASEPAALPTQPLDGLRVLVVDDSDLNREVACRILQGAGAEVVLAGNGQQALRLLRAGARVDVALMDVHMPEMDGCAATRAIRDDPALAGLPVVALTAGALASERDQALAAGMDAFIGKPFEPAQLLQTLYKLTGQGGAPTWTPARPTDSGTPWPQVPGIDAAGARLRLGGDAALFVSLLQRLLDEYEDLAASPAAALDDAALEALAARAHRLRGAAATLGASDLQAGAAALEATCRAADLALARCALPVLQTSLRILDATARPILHAWEPPARSVSAESRAARGTRPQLVTLLREQRLAAIELFNNLQPELEADLGAARFRDLKTQVETLQFTQAAELLATSEAGAG